MTSQSIQANGEAGPAAIFTNLSNLTLHVIYTGVEHLHISIESAWANLEEALNHIVVQIGLGENVFY